MNISLKARLIDITAAALIGVALLIGAGKTNAEAANQVVARVSLSRQFRIAEIEHLTGDSTSMIRVDIWDQLKSHIETAEKQFRTQVDGLPGLLSAFEKPTENKR